MYYKIKLQIKFIIQETSYLIMVIVQRDDVSPKKINKNTYCKYLIPVNTN